MYGVQGESSSCEESGSSSGESENAEGSNQKSQQSDEEMNEENGEDEVNESGYSNSCSRRSEQHKKNDKISSNNEDGQIKS